MLMFAESGVRGRRRMWKPIAKMCLRPADQDHQDLTLSHLVFLPLPFHPSSLTGPWQLIDIIVYPFCSDRRHTVSNRSPSPSPPRRNCDKTPRAGPAPFASSARYRLKILLDVDQRRTPRQSSSALRRRQIQTLLMAAPSVPTAA